MDGWPAGESAEVIRVETVSSRFVNVLGLRVILGVWATRRKVC